MLVVIKTFFIFFINILVGAGFLVCTQKKLKDIDIKLQNLKKQYLYTQDQWVCIVRIVNQLKHMLQSGDLLLCPGRSCIHFANIIQFNEYCAINDISVKIPAFSKGHYVLESTRALDHGDYREIELTKRVLQKKIDKLPKNFFENYVNTLDFIKEFENTPFYFDFDAHQVKESKKFKLSVKYIKAYRDYLSKEWDITPQSLKRVKGNIIVFDSVCSGKGTGGFLKIILDWCREEEVDIATKIKIINFNYRIRETPVFEANNPIFTYWKTMTYLIVPEKIWREFSFNHVRDLSFFFPPWSWHKKQLWQLAY